MSKLIIPLVDRNFSDTEIEKNILNLTYSKFTKSTYFAYVLSFTGGVNNEYINMLYDNFNSPIGFGMKINNTLIYLKGEVTIIAGCNEYPSNHRMEIRDYENPQSQIYATFYPLIESLGNSRYKIAYKLDEYVSIPGIAKFGFVEMGQTIYNIDLANSGGKIVFSPRNEKVEINGKYYFVPNLPDMKQIDFIKAIAQILGVFAIPIGNDTVQLVSVDEITRNKEVAINWTKKVVASSHDNKPKSMIYILDGFARNNKFMWKEDNTVLGDYNGNLLIDDKTIEYERNAVTIPFAASDMKDGIAFVPIYSYDQDGVLNYSPGSVQPRLLIRDGVNGVFTGLDWNSLIADNYSSYQSIIKTPKIIKEKIEVSDIELRELDMTVPVYLGQYGRYYAIISVRAEDTGVCDCELLQL